MPDAPFTEFAVECELNPFVVVDVVAVGVAVAVVDVELPRLPVPATC